MTGVALVTQNPQSSLASGAHQSLTAARVETRVVAPDELPAAQVHVLLDDSGLPKALARLIQGTSGREALPDTILVVDDARRGGLLLGDGFRDVTSPEDTGEAVLAIKGGRPPIVYERIKKELEERLLPALLVELRLRSHEAARLLSECLTLAQARRKLVSRRMRLEKLTYRQTMNDGLVAVGLVQQYAKELDTIKRPRLRRLGRFPKLRLDRSALLSGEPWLPRRKRKMIADLVAWLDNAELTAPLAAEPRARIDAIVTKHAREPLAALAGCIEVFDAERDARLEMIAKLQREDEPSEAVTRWLAEQHGFEVMANNYAMPEPQAHLIRSHIHPPPEIYKTWCLDLTSLKVVLTSDVLPVIAHTLAPASTAERRANGAPPEFAIGERQA